MSTTIERSRLLTHARTILDTAKNAGRDLNDAEAAEVEANITKIKALDAKPKGDSIVQRVLALGTSNDYDADGRPRDGFFTAEAKDGIVGAIKSRTAFRTELSTKAALTTGTMLPTSGSAVQGGLHPNQYALAGLFQNLPADGPSQRYYRMTAGAAAVVAEGALKPDAGVGHYTD